MPIPTARATGGPSRSIRGSRRSAGSALPPTARAPLNQFSSILGGAIDIQGGSYDLTKLTNVDGSSLIAANGASLSLPLVTSYNPENFYVSFLATGANGPTGSLLSLPALASLTTTDYYGEITLQATFGGDLELPILPSIITSATDTPVNVTADGPGSVVDIADVASFSTSQGSLGATNQGTVEINPSLTILNGVTLSLDGTGNIPESQFTAINNGGIDDTGGSYTSADFSKLTSFNGSGLSVSGGGKLVLTGVTTFDPLGNDVTFGATGTNSLLSLPNLATLEASSYYYGGLNFSATSGGLIDLPLLASISTGDSVSIIADGASSAVDAPILTTYDTSYADLQVTDSGTVELSAALTSLTGVTLVLDGTGTIDESQFTSISNGGIRDEGGVYTAPSDFSGLTSLSGSSLAVTGGGSLVLSGVLTFDYSGTYPDFSADGGSVLSLPNLGTITASSYGYLTMTATDGGDIELPSVSSIDTGSAYAPVSISANGAGSLVDLSDLSDFNAQASSMSATEGGVIIVPLLTTLNGVTVTLDNAESFPLTQFTAITNGGIDDLGVVYTSSDLANLTDVDGSSLMVSSGGALPLLAVTTFTDDNYNSPEFSASSGGTLDLSNLASITELYDSDITADGQNSLVDLSGLTSWSSTYGGGSLSATNGGTITLYVNTTSLGGLNPHDRRP